MAALDEDRLTLPDLREVQLIDREYDVFGGARVANDCYRAFGGIGARFFKYQCAPVLCPQYGGKGAGDARQVLEGQAQGSGVEADLPRPSD
jgi:hypothetical protein